MSTTAGGVRDRSVGGARTLRVGTLMPAAAELTAPILEAFCATFPQTRVSVADVSERGGENALLSGGLDVAFLWTPVTWEHLAVVPLFDDHLVAIVGTGHRLESQSSLSVSDLADERYTMSMTMSDRWRQASVLRPWRDHPDHAVFVPGPAGALQAIASGRAVSIGPASLARMTSPARLRFVPLEVSGGPTSVLCRRRGDRRRMTAAFLDVAAGVAASYRPPSPPVAAVRPAVEPAHSEPVTQRELEVLLALAGGLSAQQIGRRLSISPGTVRKHLEHVYAKLGCHDRLSAVNRAREIGVLAAHAGRG